MENKPASSVVGLFGKVLNEKPLSLKGTVSDGSSSQWRRSSLGQLVERRASIRKVAKPWFDSRFDSVTLCP